MACDCAEWETEYKNKLRGGAHLAVLVVDGRIILKGIRNKKGWEFHLTIKTSDGVL